MANGTSRSWDTMSNKALVNAMNTAKEKANKFNADYKAAATELQRRAMQELDNHNTKFVRFHGTSSAVTVCKKGSLSILSGHAFKNKIGADLFDSEVTTEQSISFKPKTPFESALKAIFLKDYDFDMKMDEVYDALGADADQRSVLDKKLKGQYDKDAETLEAMFGTKDFDAELYCIYKIKNAEKIHIFFPDATEEELAEYRKYLLVEESISVTLAR